MEWVTPIYIWLIYPAKFLYKTCVPSWSGVVIWPWQIIPAKSSLDRLSCKNMDWCKILDKIVGFNLQIFCPNKFGCRGKIGSWSMNGWCTCERFCTLGLWLFWSLVWDSRNLGQCHQLVIVLNLVARWNIASRVCNKKTFAYLGPHVLKTYTLLARYNIY